MPPDDFFGRLKEMIDSIPDGEKLPPYQVSASTISSSTLATVLEELCPGRSNVKCRQDIFTIEVFGKGGFKEDLSLGYLLDPGSLSELIKKIPKLVPRRYFVSHEDATADLIKRCFSGINWTQDKDYFLESASHGHSVLVPKFSDEFKRHGEYPPATDPEVLNVEYKYLERKIGMRVIHEKLSKTRTPAFRLKDLEDQREWARWAQWYQRDDPKDLAVQKKDGKYYIGVYTGPDTVRHTLTTPYGSFSVADSSIALKTLRLLSMAGLNQSALLSTPALNDA
ncbi:hypothetical protein F4778DRAFT_724080 [Xylariomycetidae sp. FL2044]|nr:hypothetical protein F4778DRAFT_724080 [Xylariomycetidae sp. FL2044]